MTRALHRSLLLAGLGLSLGACVAAGAGGPGPRAVRSVGPGPSTKAPSAPPSQAASPRTGASPSPPAASGRLLMPSRLGLVLPATLVGPEARLSLTGGDGAVDFQGSRVELTPAGGIISNHSGALISDQGGNLISDQGGGIISNHSGALISDQGGGLISDQGGGLGAKPGAAFRAQPAGLRRLQAELGTEPLNDPRLHLWLVLTLIDLNDQLIKGFVDAKPRLGEWQLYGGTQVRILPPPVLGELLRGAMGGIQTMFETWRFAGLMTEEGGGTHLRVVALKEAAQPLKEGFVMLDLVASGADEAVARTRFMPELGALFGLDGSAASVHWRATPEGPVVEVEEAEHFLPKEQRTGLGAYLTGSSPQVLGRRRLRLQAPRGGQRHWGDIGSVNLMAPKEGLTQRQFYVAIGYAKPFGADDGLALFNLRRTFLAGEDPPGYRWNNPFSELDVAREQGPVPTFMTPGGKYTDAPGPALKAYLPPWDPAAPEALIPAPLGPEARPHEDPRLAPPSVPEALLALPLRRP